jgi:aldehyde:ferredoxin oxidoreductase
VARLIEKPIADVAGLDVSEKRALLMRHRKEELHKLIHTYYQERGWSAAGIPTPETLQRIGLWNFLKQETREKISQVAGG